MELTAFYYDGRTSQKKEVRIMYEQPGQLLIKGLENDLIFAMSEIRFSSRLGNTARYIYLPGGCKCETFDNDAIDIILKQNCQGCAQSLLHQLESKFRSVLLALFITVFGTWSFIEYGIPALAQRTAILLPNAANTALSKDGLMILDRTVFSPSSLDLAAKHHLDSLFSEITRGIAAKHDFNLVFRSGDKVGPNAFALPSGTIVITDDLIRFAQHDNELVAVFAHEIGHVVHRHALRSLLQNSVVVLVLATVTGDITSITALSGALPTILLEAKYSRAFELEADQYAIEFLLAHGISPGCFADLLFRLEQETGYDNEIPNYLASHPATGDRVKLFKSE